MQDMIGAATIEFGIESNLKHAPFLIESTEGQDNEVRFVVSLANRGETGILGDEALMPLKQLVSQCAPLYPDSRNIFEIVFTNYILHMVRNESYTFYAHDEIRHGNYFILFERSGLLDNLSRLIDSRLVEAVIGKEPRHYGIYCQNQIIDIITTNAPTIKRLIEK